MTTATACGRCKGSGQENTETEYRECPMCGRSGDAVPCQSRCPLQGCKCGNRRCGAPSVDWDDESPRCEAHLKGK
jgi:hypothetical protein